MGGRHLHPLEQLVLNETAGFMDPKRKEAAASVLGLKRKTSNYHVVRNTFETHPILKKRIDPKTKFFHYDPKIPDKVQHIAPELYDLAKFRHFFKGSNGSITFFHQMLLEESGEKLREEVLNLKDTGEEFVKLGNILKKFNLQTQRADPTQNIGPRDVEAFIAFGNRLTAEGWSIDPEVRAKDVKLVNLMYDAAENGTGTIESLVLPK